MYQMLASLNLWSPGKRPALSAEEQVVRSTESIDRVEHNIDESKLAGEEVSNQELTEESSNQELTLNGKLAVQKELVEQLERTSILLHNIEEAIAVGDLKSRPALTSDPGSTQCNKIDDLGTEQTSSDMLNQKLIQKNEMLEAEIRLLRKIMRRLRKDSDAAQQARSQLEEELAISNHECAVPKRLVFNSRKARERLQENQVVERLRLTKEKSSSDLEDGSDGQRAETQGQLRDLKELTQIEGSNAMATILRLEQQIATLVQHEAAIEAQNYEREILHSELDEALRCLYYHDRRSNNIELITGGHPIFEILGKLRAPNTYKSWKDPSRNDRKPNLNTSWHISALAGATRSNSVTVTDDNRYRSMRGPEYNPTVALATDPTVVGLRPMRSQERLYQGWPIMRD